VNKKTVPNVQQKVTVFDPLQDENDNAASPGFATQKYSKYDQINNANQIKQNVVDKGNESVLNVLTGTNSKETTTKNDEFDTGTDPFAEFGDNSLNDTKLQKNKISDDPFADIGGSAFDDPIMSEPIKPKQTQNENIFAAKVNNVQIAQPKSVQNENIFAPKVNTAPLKKQNSDNIILDMFADGAPPDPNLNKQKEKESNPFGDDLSNPFGTDIQTINTKNDESNPFDSLGDPFASTDDVNVESNPFESLDDPFASTDNIKSDEFMAERDPFAGM